MNGELTKKWLMDWMDDHDFTVPHDALQELLEALHRTTTPAPGALPELPEAVMTAYTKADGLTPFWVYDGMPLVHIGRHDDCGSNKAIPLITHEQASAYAEQCRAGAVVTDEVVRRVMNYVPEGMKDYHRIGCKYSTSFVRAALQSAFADDEGVKS